jgi:phosphopantetheinyl transferase
VQKFSAREFQGLRNMPAAAIAKTALIVWMRKEAWLKASGSRLSIALNTLEVGLTNSPRSLTLADGRGAWTIWVQSLELASGMFGAVALASVSRHDSDCAQ